MEQGDQGHDLRFAATRATTSRSCSSLYREGQLKLDELITTRYSLDEINEGYQAMRDGKNIRGVIVVR